MLARVPVFSHNIYLLLNKIHILSGQIVIASPGTSRSDFHWLEYTSLWKQRWSTALSQQHTHYTTRCFYFHIARGATGGPLFSFSPRRIFQCTYNSRNECSIAYLKKFLSRPSEIQAVLHSPVLYECTELSEFVLRGNSGENQQQQQQRTNTTPSPPSSLMTIMYYLIIAFCNPSSLMSHCMNTITLPEHHPREVISVLSVCLQTRCVVFPHAYVIIFL